ncbi:FG-GAP-like repeat-containing protein [Lysobacter sp. KIS68-7]|uniref:NHL domain-containing protein n=1 Tax=Lysobacter sp. KIS68-7 TaxID=2904252 RepID=UPI001E47B5FA|nr:FG-GAP-like repeat-containing protein [Lysobacter sp. KIS68-7]UHQ18452.1 FG-GAP-like repeat-containing protein [Lysobacter sp. KIS68-7]
MRKTQCAIFAIALACGAAVAAEPTIDTIAGGGTGGPNDGGPAKLAVINEPTDIALDAAGNLYIAETCRIRKVTPAGVITTLAGNGANDKPPVNGAQATSGSVCSDTVAVDRFGYVWYSMRWQVGKIAPNGVVTIVAGTGVSGYSGDGGQAASAKVSLVQDVAFDAAGNAYIADDNRVRKIATNGVITTVAGNGTWGEAGDYGPATAAQLSPTDLAVDRFGNLFIADRYGYSVRKVDTTGMISRVMGGWPRFRSDPVANVTRGFYPSGLATDSAGNLFVSNLGNLVSLISTSGAIQHVVGVFNDTTFDDGGYGSQHGFAGDGGPASLAKLYEPEGIAVDAQGNLYIADTRNMRIRKVTGKFTVPSLPAGASTLTHATPQRLVSMDQYSVGVVKGDANGDGLDDLFVLGGSWDSTNPYPGDWMLHVYRQNTDGTLADPLSYPVLHLQLTDVMGIDLNHDRYTDIVFTGYGNDAYSGLYVMLGGPTGMAKPVHYTGISGANGAFYLQQADMDGDGNMDVLVVLSTGGSGVGTIYSQAIYYSNGTGGLVRKKFAPVTDSGVTLIHDFNGDGKPDMLYGWSALDDSGIAVAYHDGVDNFLPPIRYSAGGPDKSGFFPVVGDFDSNGQPDIILSIDANAPYAKLTHWVRTPEGGFAYVGEWPAYDEPQTLVAADMNRDGRDDLLVAHFNWESVGYMQQTKLSDGTYALDRETKKYANIGNQAQPHSVTIGDFNHDACPDVAFVSTNSGLQIQYSTLQNCLREKNGAKSPPPPLRGKTTTTLSSATSGATPSTSPTTTSNVYASIVNLTRKGWASFTSQGETLRFAVGFLTLGFAMWFGLAMGRSLMRR